MQPYIRVKRTIRGLTVDRVPRGEIFIDPCLCCKFFKTESLSFELLLRFWEEFQLDLVVLSSPDEQMPGADLGGGELRDNIRRWRHKTEYYVFALISGGFSQAIRELGFNRFMEIIISNPAAVLKEITRHAQEMTIKAKEALDAGAHGIIIADDIAYRQGTYLSPAHLRDLYFPVLQIQVETLKADNVDVFFHSDGNLNRVMPDLLTLGLDGVQCLEPSSGMDLKEIKQEYGHKLCLMGNLDLSLLAATTPEDVLYEKVADTMQVGKKGGRYIFSTTGGLHRDLPLEQVSMMLRFALETGQY